MPNAAGGAADITARTIAQKISGPLGQSVIIDNKPSAGGIVAGELVARAEPDGHTILLVSSGTAVSAALFKSLPFDPLSAVPVPPSVLLDSSLPPPSAEQLADPASMCFGTRPRTDAARCERECVPVRSSRKADRARIT